jgi:agmatine deiminase
VEDARSILRPAMIDHPACKNERRRVLAAGAATLAMVALRAGAQDAEGSSFRIPGEFEPQRAIWLGYDVNLEDTTLALVRALSPYTALKFLVSDGDAEQRARRLLSTHGLLKGEVSFDIEPLAMYYPRDGAVFATAGSRRLGVVDFKWNQYGMPSWCQRRHRESSARQAHCQAQTDTRRDRLDQAVAALTNAQLLPNPLVMEGGGIESNGQGLLIACEAMVRNRNAELTRQQAQQHLLRLPGVRRVIWLPEGLAHDPHLRARIVGPYVAWGTGGHTDEFVRFADERTVLLAWPDEEEARRHPVARLNLQRMQRNASLLASARTLRGEALNVLRVPMPRIIERPRQLSDTADVDRFDEWTPDFFTSAERLRAGDTVIQVATASYLNFVIGNGVLVLPDYLPHGTSAATQARVTRQFQRAFPGRDIRFVDASVLNWLGGGLHCATLHEPLTR